MKLLPFLVIYASSGKVLLSSVSQVHAGPIAAVNDALADMNTNFANYGFEASPNLPQLPSIPVSGAGLFYSSDESQVLVDSKTSYGFNLPDVSDKILVDAVVSQLAGAQVSLAPTISVQPADTSKTAPAAATFSVTAAGAGLSYQWQKSTDAGTTWVDITNTGVYTTATTATLHVSNSTGLDAVEYRVLVTNNSGSVTSAAATLTVA